jgi:transcriptional regulator with XRE-family HTH domain
MHEKNALEMNGNAATMAHLTNAEGAMLQERIRSLRRQHKWSQEELAQKLGCDRVTVSHYEHGRAIPPLYVAQKIAQLFEVSLDSLLEEDPEDDALALEASLSP